MRIIILALTAIMLTTLPIPGECRQPRLWSLQHGVFMAQAVRPQPPEAARYERLKKNGMWRCLTCNRNITWAHTTIAQMDIEEHEEIFHRKSSETKSPFGGCVNHHPSIWNSHLTIPTPVPRDYSEPLPPFPGTNATGSFFQ